MSYDGKCYLCRRTYYGMDNTCPKCGAIDPTASASTARKMIGEIAETRSTHPELDRLEKAKPESKGYHTRHIEKGVLGESSKIFEEYEEFCDALEQKNDIMALLELSDMIGAIEAYAEKKHNVSLKSVLRMMKATKKAFKDGTRK